MVLRSPATARWRGGDNTSTTLTLSMHWPGCSGKHSSFALDCSNGDDIFTSRGSPTSDSFFHPSALPPPCREWRRSAKLEPSMILSSWGCGGRGGFIFFLFSFCKPSACQLAANLATKRQQPHHPPDTTAAHVHSIPTTSTPTEQSAWLAGLAVVASCIHARVHAL